MTSVAPVTAPAAAPARRAPLWWILARHEWRLTIRDFGGGSRGPGAPPPKVRGRKLRIARYVLVAVGLHVLGAVALAFPRRWTDTPAERFAAVVVVLFLFTLMLSTAMSRVVAAFHERRDLDLLLGAPVSPMLILVVRALTVVAAVSATFALFIYPVVDVGVVAGRWWMARLYPLVPMMAMLGTAVALMLTGTFVRLVGVRRARVGLQIFSALVGASVYLVSQARQFLPGHVVKRATDWIGDATQAADAPWPVAFAAALAGGDPSTWLGFAIACIALFVAAVWMSRHRFLAIALAPEADSRAVPTARGSVDRRVASGFGQGAFAAMLAKEWRLILRAPQLLSQILLQLLYLAPLMLVAFGHDRSRVAWSASAFAAGIVGVTATLATSLAWLTVGAEDAPDLIACSPKSRALILSSKLVAAVLPPATLVAIAALGTAGRSPADAALVFVYGVLACVAAAILAVASPRAGKRSDFQRRHQGRGGSALVEAVQFLLWAAAAGMAVAGLWIAALATTVVAAAMPAWRLPAALRRLDDVDRRRGPA